MKDIPDKLELVEAVDNLFINYWESIFKREGIGRSVVTNESGHEAF